MSDIFQKKLKLIDKNITELNSNTLEIKESLELLKTTTNLLNSANDMIIAQNNTINNETNNFLLGNSIEKYYKELLNRKKQISDLTVKYKDIVKEKKMQLEGESINNSDNETDFLLRKKRPEIDLQFVINKKEKLVNKGQKDLEEIKNDIEQIQENINKQKDDLAQTVKQLDEIKKESESYLIQGEVNPSVISNYSIYIKKMQNDIKLQNEIAQKRKKLKRLTEVDTEKLFKKYDI